MSRPAPHALAGIALVIAACACFSVLDTTTKYISAWVPLLMALWFRYAFQAIATTLVIVPAGRGNLQLGQEWSMTGMSTIATA